MNFQWGLDGEPQQMVVQNGLVVSRTKSTGPLSPFDGETIDLQGFYLLPKFVDAHCHILPTGLDLGKLNLGTCRSREEVLDRVRDQHLKTPEGWLLAVHYNQTNFSDGLHLTRAELDRISSTRPIMLEHVNGHATLANSAALQLAGVDDSTPDPSGGSYERDIHGHLNGLCLEHAHEHMQRAIPMLSIEEMASAIVAAGEKMAELGIGCASDMMTGCIHLEQELKAYALAAQMGCPIHLRLYLQWRDVFGKRALPKERLQELFDEANAQPTLRVAGIKIFSDGGISSATAAIYGRFLSTDPSKELATYGGRETDGKLIYSPERLNQMFLTAHEAGYQVSVHAIGDYATDLVMDAMAQTDEPSRHRLEHAMILSDSQIDRMHSLGCYCTFQPEFLAALGPAYGKQLGPERASRLIRSRSVLDAGIPLSFNSDRPIVAGNPWTGILTSSNRPAGFDPAENCTRAEAILAYTAAGSAVNGDGDVMGTLVPGSMAHFQLYKENPLTAAMPVVSHLVELA